MYIRTGSSCGTDTVGVSSTTARLPLSGASSKSGGREYLALIVSPDTDKFVFEKALETPDDLSGDCMSLLEFGLADFGVGMLTGGEATHSSGWSGSVSISFRV
jgi:hypothetical protein